MTTTQAVRATEIAAVRQRLGRLVHQRLTRQLSPADARSYEKLCLLERSLIDAASAVS